MRTALLFSGGADSVAAWFLLGRPNAVYVRIGHAYQDRELRTIDHQMRSDPRLNVKVLQGPDLGDLEQADGHIPHRNALLAATVAAHGYERILLGALAGEASPDKQPRFMRALSQMLSTSESHRVVVEAPLRRYTKTGAIRRLLREHPEAWPMLNASRSCYGNSDEPCLACQACFRRWVAFRLNHLPAGPRPSTPRIRPRLLLDAGVAAWPGIVRNNWDAVRAFLYEL